MAEESMVPVKSGKGKSGRAESLAVLDEIESEMERVWRRPWGFWSGAHAAAAWAP